MGGGGGQEQLAKGVTREVFTLNQVIIAQWLASRLATGEFPGSNPIKGDNSSISD